jgi:hypothetical protein
VIEMRAGQIMSITDAHKKDERCAEYSAGGNSEFGAP